MFSLIPKSITILVLIFELKENSTILQLFVGMMPLNS